MSSSCSTSVNKINIEAGGYWDYGFYDNCWYENDIRRKNRQLITIDEQDQSENIRYYGPPIGRRVTTTTTVDKTSSSSYYIGGNGYACGGPNAQIAWLNRPEVMQALHIPEDGNFFQCDNGVGFTYNLTETDLISWYKEIVTTNTLRVLVYNGDTDPCINSFQAQNWTRSLGFSEVQAWRPWTVDGCQSMGGYVTRYEKGLDFLTIRGSGHMVPQDRPQVSLEFISRFLKGEDYPQYQKDCVSPDKMNKYSKVEVDANKKEILQEMREEQRMYEMKLRILHEKLHRVSSK